MAYFKNGLFQKMAYFKNGLFQNLAYLKYRPFLNEYFVKNATTFGNALYKHFIFLSNKFQIK